MAGRAALYMLAMRLMHARNRIRSRTPRWFSSHRTPSPADRVRGTFSAGGVSGNSTPQSRVPTAAAQVARSKTITASSPSSPSRAVARTGESRVVRDWDRDSRPDTRCTWSLGVSRVTTTSLTGYWTAFIRPLRALSRYRCHSASCPVFSSASTARVVSAAKVSHMAIVLRLSHRSPRLPAKMLRAT
jgi:hypothetical protein